MVSSTVISNRFFIFDHRSFYCLSTVVPSLFIVIPIQASDVLRWDSGSMNCVFSLPHCWSIHCWSSDIHKFIQTFITAFVFLLQCNLVIYKTYIFVYWDLVFHFHVLPKMNQNTNYYGNLRIQRSTKLWIWRFFCEVTEFYFTDQQHSTKLLLIQRSVCVTSMTF